MAIHGLAISRPRVAATPSAAHAALRLATRGLFATLVALAAVLALVTVGPRVLPYQALPVLTGSMEPAIPTGALAVIVPVRGEEVAVGDVITFNHPLRAEAYLTHRVVDIAEGSSGRTFGTKGDANALPDEWRVSGSSGGWRLAFAIPSVGAVLLAVWSSEVRLTLFVCSLFALAALALLEIWRPRQRKVRPAVRTA